MRHIPMLALATLTLAGCATQQAATGQSSHPEAISYRCAEGVEMAVIYDGPATGLRGTADLNWDGHRFPLKQTESGSGATYSDGTLTLYTKGDEAFVEKAGERVLRDCNAKS